MSDPPALLLVVRDRTVVGELEVLRNTRMRLRYLPAAETSGPLSVSLPLTRKRHQDNAVRPWIEGLFPDRPALLRAWRRHFGLADQHPFPLLAHVGEDVAGAAQFVRPERLEDVLSAPGRLERLTDEQVADLLAAALADAPITAGMPGTGRFSLAGAQAKVVLRRLPHNGWTLPVGAAASTHILKPAIPALPDQDIVEAVTMRTARAIGLSTARVDLLSVAGMRSLVVERFDRVASGEDVVRVHQEDACQALGIGPLRKYESEGGPSAGVIANLLGRVSAEPPEDRLRFARALVFNALIGATDAHARNYSLLLGSRDATGAALRSQHLGGLRAAGERRVGDVRRRRDPRRRDP